jgi:uncharacterized membrane protein YfcA
VDEALSLLLLIAAGAVMGFVNNLAGAGGAVGLAAFDLVSGLPVSQANASLRPAALAIAGAGALGFVSKQRHVPRRAWLYGLAAAPGALLGTWMAVRLPDLVYEISLMAVVALLLAQMLFGKPIDPRGQRATSLPIAFCWFTAVGAHMGFIQVGVGLLTMAALGHVHSRDLVEVNTAKMAVVAVTATVSVAVFATAGQIAWGPALGLAIGAGIGSFAAGRWSVRRGHGAIRVVVVAVCVLVLVRSVWRLT